MQESLGILKIDTAYDGFIVHTDSDTNEGSFMSTAILYSSKHHGNTKKVVDAIAETYGLKTFDIDANPDIDVDDFDCIGFAGGVAYGRIYGSVKAAAERFMEPGKKVFFIYTCGKNSRDFSAPLQALADERGCTSLGSFGCIGWDSFGPLKLAGGLNKDRPNESDLADARTFYENVMRRAEK